MLHRSEYLQHVPFQRREERVHVADLVAGDPRLETVDDAPGRIDADIGGEEYRLDVFEQGIVDGRACADDLGDSVGDGAACLAQRLAETSEQGHAPPWPLGANPSGGKRINGQKSSAEPSGTDKEAIQSERTTAAGKP